MHDGIVADEAEICRLSSAMHYRVRVWVPCGLVIVSTLLLLLLLLGVLPTGAVNTCMMILTASYIIAGFIRRSAALLFTEAGKLTYRRVRAMNVQLVPRTMMGRAIVFTLAADSILLPFLIGISTFHTNIFMSVIGTLVLPPHTQHSSVPFYLLFWVVPFLGMATMIFFHGAVMMLYRRDPYYFATGVWSHVPNAAIIASALLAIPSLTMAFSALPCDGEHMRYARGNTCGGGAHRFYAYLSTTFIVLFGSVLEYASYSMLRLRDLPAKSLHAEIRCDALMMDALLTWRCLVIMAATIFPGVFGCFLIILFTAHVGCVAIFSSTYFPTSISSLTVVVRAAILATVTSAVLCMLLVLFGLRYSPGGAVLWLLLWLSSSAGIGYWSIRQLNMPTIFEPVPVVMDIF